MCLEYHNQLKICIILKNFTDSPYNCGSDLLLINAYDLNVIFANKV